MYIYIHLTVKVTLEKHDYIHTYICKYMYVCIYVHDY